MQFRRFTGMQIILKYPFLRKTLSTFNFLVSNGELPYQRFSLEMIEGELTTEITSEIGVFSESYEYELVDELLRYRLYVNVLKMISRQTIFSDHI